MLDDQFADEVEEDVAGVDDDPYGDDGWISRLGEKPNF